MTALARRFGPLATLLALVLALGGTARAAAQDDTVTGIPDGATDGATIAFSPESADDPQAPIYGFSVFTFDDDDAADAGLDDYLQQFQDSIDESEDVDADIVELDADEVDGLDDIGDEAHAYTIDYSADEDLAGFGFGVLAVRDGDQLQFWTAIIFDFSALTGETDATAEPVDPRAGVDALLEIAPDWFDGDKPDDGELIDQLPGLDQLPDGYEETSRAEGLDEITDQQD